MLYLAEVQKQKGGLLGGGSKTELKLLACQRTDQNWSNVSEEAIAAEDASKLNDGALVLVELNPQRQVQRIQEAGRPLVNILQNFSRQVEKFKLKEEEIDQWKESLTFQAQELNRREMEMEARAEQLQQMDDDFQRLEAEKQEVDTSKQEIERLRQEFERNRQELEGAWEHLRGEQRRLEEHQAEFQQPNVLDEEQSRVLSELLDRLSSQVDPNLTVREHLNFALEMVESQQATLNPHWQQLESLRTAATQQQEELDQLEQTKCDRAYEWQQAQNAVLQQTADLKMNTASLASKQECARMLKQQLQHQEDLHQQIQFLVAISGDVVLGEQVNVEALEKMPLQELQQTVQDLHEKLQIDSSFVHEQEVELKFKQDIIDELQSKLNQASDNDHINLEMELADEKDLYQMLNETLVGQRRSLLLRQESFKQHQAVLHRRQGQSANEDDQKIDLVPILRQIEAQQQQQSEELENLEREIEEIRSQIELADKTLNNQIQEQEEKHQELKVLEENLQLLRIATAEYWAKVNVYQETLQPIQDSLDGLRHKLQGIAESLATVQETGDYQLQTITQMRQTILSLIQPELLAS
ncbi:pilus motility taxis protein HmpF [Tolypothrix sp. VBCCA 56010]|uniref:pilus motility taxis protein HmpF n=1 Tax=Tolypothrix sp. VBCCA 56010 TaxID=3137731 RepID=UPI003D7CA854